jgi:hypothetical protein
MPESVAPHGCRLGRGRGRGRGPLAFIDAHRARKASVATEAAAGARGPIDFLNNANKREKLMVVSTAVAVDVLQATSATDTAGGGGFMYAQHERKASVATEAAAGGGGPIAFINNANKHEQPMVADLQQTTNISTAAAVDVLQAAPATDSAESRTAPCSAAAAAREDLVEYLASQVGCGAMTVRMMSTLSEKNIGMPAGRGNIAHSRHARKGFACLVQEAAMEVIFAGLV